MASSKKPKSTVQPSSRKRKQKTPVPASFPLQFQQVNLNAAGIDIGNHSHHVAVPPDRAQPSVREFPAFTSGLNALVAWLHECQIETVAMESTGVYWIALFELLDREGFEVFLVDPHHLKHVSGRKSDVLDCQWIQKLHAHGLLSAAFRPPDQVCVLRCYARQRALLVTHAAQHVQHMQKALTQMNLKLTLVLSDLTGVTGMNILHTILDGERDPHRLAALRDRRCQHSVDEIAQALEGTWRDEHLFSLRQAVELFEFHQKLIAACDEQIEACLKSLPDALEGKEVPPMPRTCGKKRLQPTFPLREYCFRWAGVDLTRVPGLDAASVFTILSEIGTDMSRWPTEDQFCSWLNLCPGTKISGGNRLSSRMRTGKNRAAQAFRIAANSLSRSPTALGSFLRRMKARQSAPVAITATAHKLARTVYSLLKNGQEYVEPDPTVYEEQHRQRVLSQLKRKAQQWGFDLVERVPAATSTTPTPPRDGGDEGLLLEGAKAKAG